MTVLAVDLAARYSAACLMDDDYHVIAQFDSWQTPESRFIDAVAEYFAALTTPEVLVVEDLPHGLSYTTLVKTVCRLQGRLFDRVDSHMEGEKVLFLAPIQWRNHYGLKRGTGPTIVVPTAATFGYQPPDLLARAKGNGGPSRAAKIATDYCSAYLIARWAVDTKKKYGSYDVTGTSRYDTNAIKKKDFDAQQNG